MVGFSYYIILSHAEKTMSISIRKAEPGDIESMFDLMKYYSDRDIILKRTRDEIAEYLDNFFVAVDGSELAGVVSYYDYGPHLKEIRSLCVRGRYSRKGTGSLLVRHMIGHLSRGNPPKIFVLTYSPGFFEKSGFTRIQKDTLPEKIWKDCNNCKNRDNCRETAMFYERSVGNTTIRT